MAIEIVDFPMKNGDFPWLFWHSQRVLSEGIGKPPCLSLIQTSGDTVALFVVDHPALLTWLDGLHVETPCVWRSPQWKHIIYIYMYNIYIYVYSRQVSITLVLTAIFHVARPQFGPLNNGGAILWGQRIPGDFCQRLTGIHCRQLWDLRWKWATSSMNIFGVLLFTSLDIFWSTCCYVGPKVLNHLGLFFAPPS